MHRIAHMTSAMPMSPKREAAARALKRVAHLHPSVHAEVLAELDRQGLFDANSGPAVSATAADDAFNFVEARKRCVMTQMQAAQDPRNLALLRNIRGQARHLGVEDLLQDQTKPIDVVELDKRLRGKDTEARFRFKDMLYFCKLIPA